MTDTKPAPGTPVPVTPSAAGAPPAPVGPAPNDLSLAALLWRCNNQVDAGQREYARDSLLQLRGWRLLIVGPKGGGKTTAITGMGGRLGRVGVCSLDRDMKPTPNAKIYRLPEPEDRTQIPVLSRAHTACMAEMKSLRGTAGEFHVYLLDTVTTLKTIITSFRVEGDTTGMMGLDTTNMEGMRQASKEADVCITWAKALWRMCGKACELSSFDGPLVFAVTEHARPMSKGEALPRYKADGEQIVDLAFHSWVPQIGRNAGNAIEGQCDMVLGYSMECGEHPPYSRICNVSSGHSKNRLTPIELEIFTAIMSGLAMDRLATALSAIYTRRKALWLKQWCGITVPGLGDAGDKAQRWATDWTPDPPRR
jgi:hypothetical protein